jgi:hypothetical protein
MYWFGIHENEFQVASMGCDRMRAVRRCRGK